MRTQRKLALVVLSITTGCADRVVVPGGLDIEPDATIHSVVVDPHSATTVSGGVLPFTVTVTTGPAATNRHVKWSSRATSIATVDSAGTVTGIAVGTAIIVATSIQDPSVGDSATVTVLRTPNDGSARGDRR